MFDEEERLRILERVSKGELTPEEGQLQIAMAKVRAQRLEPAIIEPEPERERPRASPPRQLPGLALLVPLLALPIVIVIGMVATFMSFMMALPVYLFVWFWNAHVVAAYPGAVPLAYWPSLGLVVLVMLVISLLRWGRRLQVSFMGFRGGEQ